MSGLPQHAKLFIDGQWIDTSEKYEIRSPHDESLLATCAKGSELELNAAVAAAKAAHENGDWRNLEAHQRADILEAISDRLSEIMDELVDLHVRENGVTVRTAMGFHVGYAISHLRYFADLARVYEFEHSGPLLEYPTLASGVVRREPIGVCGAIVPWNFPLLLAVWKIGPALASGNTIVVKVDEKTPLTLLKFAEVCHACGLPRGVLNVITGDGPDVGAKLAAHKDVRKIAFTGSTEVGKMIQRNAANNVKRVTLELGGKGPNIVLEDADLQEAVDGTLFAVLVYSGQACESGTRLLLHDRIYDRFMDALLRRIKSVKIGDPLSFETDMGPVISKRQQDRILRYIETAQKEGATLLYGGGIPKGKEFENGFWVEPTILSNVTNDMTVVSGCVNVRKSGGVRS